MYHLTIKILSRRKKKSVVASAAYRSGERLYDERYKCFRDFTRKGGVVYREILLPPNAPPQFGNREVLWNAVEKAETRKDSRLAREAEFALPREFSLEEQIELARAFVTENFISLGMCADLCIHHRDEKNPHAHVLLTDRPVGENGFLARKNPGWNSRALLLNWRQSWARILNEGYERKGLEKRVTHESYAARGITDRKPTKHLGHRVLAYARKHQMTDRLQEHLDTLYSETERARILKLLGRSQERSREVRRREVGRSH